MSNVEVGVLPIWPWPVPSAAMSKIRAAKESLNIERKVRPARAVAGSPGITLAFGSAPKHICEFVFCRNVHSPNLRDRVSVALTGEGEARVFGAEDLLSHWFGGTVKEVYDVDEWMKEHGYAETQED